MKGKTMERSKDYIEIEKRRQRLEEALSTSQAFSEAVLTARKKDELPNNPIYRMANPDSLILRGSLDTLIGLFAYSYLEQLIEAHKQNK